jgi:dihydrodipicolinate synthase/N-acetylneuraminate lyase
MNIQGIFVPVATPFDEREEIDLGAFRANMARWMKTGVRGVVVLGSNGEAPLLTGDEGVRLVAAAREQVPPDRALIAGAGEESPGPAGWLPPGRMRCSSAHPAISRRS